MQVRCPVMTCGLAFEVDDDVAADERLRCPACASWLSVPDRREWYESEQIQASYPPLTLDTAPKPPQAEKPVDLEHQIYDGLPPLSVMLALRSRRGRMADDEREFDIRAQMSDEDWQALAAFEAVLLAAASLKTAAKYGIVAFLVNALAWFVAAENVGNAIEITKLRWLSLWETLFILGPGFYLMFVKGREFVRLNMESLLTILPWSTLCVAMVFVANMLLSLMLIFDTRYPNSLGAMALLSVPLNLIAAFDIGRASLRVQTALRLVGPLSILQRLTRAMVYLEEQRHREVGAA